MAVDNFFYDKQLFPYLDYDLSTRVVRGIIYVRIPLYTTKAKRLSKELAKLKIPLDDESRTIAVLQIAVDKQQMFGIVGDKEPDFETLNRELGALDARLWQDIDNFDLVSPQDNQLVSGTFYPFLEKEVIATREVNVTFSLDKPFAGAHRELLPLFWNLAMLTSSNIGRELYENVGFYGTATSHRPKNRTTALVRHYRAAADVVQQLNNTRDIINDAILDLGDNDAYKRMAAELRSVSLSTPDRMFPDPIVMHDRTGIIVGSKGWNRIATDENCSLILSHMKVTVSTGRKRISVKIGSVLDIKQ